MDIYGAIDLLFIVLSILVAHKIKTTESWMFVGFVATTSFATFWLFQTDAYILWDFIFVFTAGCWALMNYKSSSAVAYMAIMALTGIDRVTSYPYFSQTAYTIYVIQLGVMYGGITFKHIWHRLGHSVDGKGAQRKC